jgi:hypothetical protein
MSVAYDYDPGRLELYRPRADGLMSRCFCGSAVIHLLVGCLLFTVHLPEPKKPKQRHYRITEIRLLPRARPATTEEPEPKKIAEAPSPRDLSLFLKDMAPPQREKRRRSSRRRARTRTQHVATRPTPALSPEMKPEGAEKGTTRPLKPGPKLAALPDLLERQMADITPAELATSDTKAGASPAPTPKRVEKAKIAEVPAPRPPKRVALKPRPVVESPRRGDAPKMPEAAPRPVEMARAERPRPLSDLLPKAHDRRSSPAPSPIPVVPVAKPATEQSERPADLPAPVKNAGKRMAELPGNLFGDGSGLGPAPSRRSPVLPAGRPGAAVTPGPRRPTLSHSSTGHAPAAGVGDLAGINPIPTPGRVRLSDEDRPNAMRRGASSGSGDLGNKVTREASLPSSGPELSGRGSGGAPSGTGGGGGYGAAGPRAFGGGRRHGRPGSSSSRKAPAFGDGAAGDPVIGGGISIGGATASPGALGASSHSKAGHGAGGGEEPGKRVARADLPGAGVDIGSLGSGHVPSGGGGNARVPSGPRSFGTGGKRRLSAPSSVNDDDGKGTGRGGGKGSGDGDGKGVALPSGGGGDNDGPGRDGGGDENDSSLKRGRKGPGGIYVSTTGNYALPGAIYDGDYMYNSRALRMIMDELNRRTKVKVQLGGRYESISPGSFRNAPVVVFTGHKAFELTDEQRKVLKQYVDKGGMIWADLAHSAFDNSFRNEMEKIFGRAPSALPSSHLIYRTFYVLHGPPPGDLGDAAQFEGISVGDRLGVVITPNRYFSAMTRSSVSDEVQEGATEAVVNIYMYAAANYRAVKDAGD